jgi:ATP-dependent Zn protease
MPYMMKMLGPQQKAAVISREAPTAIDAMADSVVEAARSFVQKAAASHATRIAALEQQMMEHSTTLGDAMRRLSVLEQNAGA